MSFSTSSFFLYQRTWNICTLSSTGTFCDIYEFVISPLVIHISEQKQINWKSLYYPAVSHVLWYPLWYSFSTVKRQLTWNHNTTIPKKSVNLEFDHCFVVYILSIKPSSGVIVIQMNSSPLKLGLLSGGNHGNFVNTHILLCCSHAFQNTHTHTQIVIFPYNTQGNTRLGHNVSCSLMCQHTGSDRNREHTKIITPDAIVVQPG